MSSEDSRSKVIEDQIVDMAYKVLKKTKLDSAQVFKESDLQKI